jgi:hypothetical protein
LVGNWSNGVGGGSESKYVSDKACKNIKEDNNNNSKIAYIIKNTVPLLHLFYFLDWVIAYVVVNVMCFHLHNDCIYI